MNVPSQMRLITRPWSTKLFFACGVTALLTSSIDLHAQATLFSAKSYQGKCLDFGAPPQVAGTPVFIYDCNGTEAQQLRPVEVNAHHDVVLYAGAKVIGVKLPPPVVVAKNTTEARRIAPAIANYELELQDRLSPIRVLAGPNPQVFALDGDSILLAANRKLAVMVQNARGENRTPLVLAPRMLADNEFWDFNTADGSETFPTTGFISITTPTQLKAVLTDFDNDLEHGLTDKWWGTVLLIAPTATTDFFSRRLAIPNGVTLHGNRRGTNLGPEIAVSSQRVGRFLDLTLLDSSGNIVDSGDHVRITGLRIRGPSRSTSVDAPFDSAMGIRARDDRDVIIDHNDMSNWPNADIEVFGSAAETATGSNCPDPRADPSTLSTIDNVRITHNFLHHNEKWGGGYGVVMSSGGNATIEGNTFLMNRHGIADDGAALSRYHAYDNIVLSNVPTYYSMWPPHGPQQDFDVHGTDPSSGSHHTGGFAGNQIDIAWNTFLGGNRLNFALRGTPCTTSTLPDYFRWNASQQSHDNAIEVDGGAEPYGALIDGSPWGPEPYLLNINSNHFSASDPTNRFGVGDFDGDGIDDIFLASGSTFFYSPGGVADWRVLGEGRTDSIQSLLFGDFDGDGRTDVIGKNGNNIMVSWGGVSNWEVLNETTAPITDLAIGDFDNDGRADIFWADGSTWRVAYGGSGPFYQSQTSSFRVKDLLFGNFRGTGETDVLGQVAGSWHVSYGATSSWTPMPGNHRESVGGMVAADFDGDGTTDVARSILVFNSTLFQYYFVWEYAPNGVGDWKILNVGLEPINSVAGIGHFTGQRAVDTLIWSKQSGSSDLSIASGVGGAFKQRSRQEMR